MWLSWTFQTNRSIWKFDTRWKEEKLFLEISENSLLWIDKFGFYRQTIKIELLV